MPRPVALAQKKTTPRTWKWDVDLEQPRLETLTWNLTLKIQSGSWSLGPETRDSGRDTRNLGPRIEHPTLEPKRQSWDLQPSPFDLVPVTWEQPTVAVEEPCRFYLLL